MARTKVLGALLAICIPSAAIAAAPAAAASTLNPASGYNNAAKVLAYARTVKAKGFKLLVDFHYSDTWADPGKQFKPRPGRATRSAR